MFSRNWVLALAAVLAIGLSSADAEQLLSGAWRPAEIGASAVPDNSEANVVFGQKGQLTGHGGCNRFFGAYEIKSKSLEIGPLGATQMACPRPIMEQETEFLRALGEAYRFRRDGDELVLMNEAGDVLVRLVHSDAE